jgi:hypothetical protein
LPEGFDISNGEEAAEPELRTLQETRDQRVSRSQEPRVTAGPHTSRLRADLAARVTAVAETAGSYDLRRCTDDISTGFSEANDPVPTLRTRSPAG